MQCQCATAFTPGLPTVTWKPEDSYECLQRRNRPVRPPLDRPPVHVHDHARPGVALLQRPLHHDRPAHQRQAAAACLQHRQCQLRGIPRVPQHQGRRGPAYLAPAQYSGRRQDHRRAQADRHAADRLHPARQAPVPAGHRHRARTVHERDPRSGDLREIREGHPGARRSTGR